MTSGLGWIPVLVIKKLRKIVAHKYVVSGFITRTIVRVQAYLTLTVLLVQAFPNATDVLRLVEGMEDQFLDEVSRPRTVTP